MNYQFQNVRALSKIKPNDILKVSSSINYSIFILISGKKLMLAKTLKECEYILEPYFFCRISRTEIINLKHCKRVAYPIVELEDNIQANISRRRRKILEEKLNSMDAKVYF